MAAKTAKRSPGKKPFKDAKSAAKAARQGQTDEALAALLAFADAGDRAASAAAAEILAFRGEWLEAAKRAVVLLEEPNAVYSSNIFNDCSAIVRRAAELTKQPSLVADAAKRVPTKYASMRDAVLLRDYYRASEEDRVPKADAYAKAVADAPSIKRLEGKPSALERHCFALAIAHDMDDAIIERWNPEGDLLDFNQAVEAARAFMRKGRADDAWKAIASKTWWPIENTQIAPVELVTDFRILPLMTKDRCEAILAKPRGS